MAIIVSLDIETTGLNPEYCQVLEIGAIIYDTTNPKSYEESPKFHTYIRHFPIVGEPYALNLNNRIISMMADKNKSDLFCSPEEAVDRLETFLRKYQDVKDDDQLWITLAGKNVLSFDLQFLKRLPNFEKKINVRHRALDPAILYFDPEKDDSLPGTEICKQRANLGNTVKHEALADAWDVIQLLELFFKKKKFQSLLLKEL
jgi:DNA polymerase III epsilon subunit-like protein